MLLHLYLIYSQIWLNFLCMDDWLNYMLYLYVEYAVSSDSQDNRIKNA
jgi:hypothetical protein